MWGGFICGVWLLLTLLVWAVCSAISRYMKSPEYRAWKTEEANRQQEAAIRAEKNAARQHLLDFCNTYPELAEILPLLKAFIASRMTDDLTPADLWAVCHDKIAELQPLIAKERKAEADGNLEARIAILRAEHHRRVTALRTLGDSLDPESREAVEYERLIEEEMTRFKKELQKLNPVTS